MHEFRQSALVANGQRPDTQVLVVDDDEDIVDAVSMVIEHELTGVQVRSSTCPKAALELASPRRVDLLMTDLEMPGMDGIELTQRVRDLWPTTQAVLVTGHDVDPDLWNRARAVGVRRVLPKPFRVQELLGAVEDVLGQEPGWAGKRTPPA